MTAMTAMNEQAWRRLINAIGSGSVVPVVGSRLLVDDKGAGSLQAKVAAKLLADYGVDIPAGGLPPFRELNEAVTMLLDLDGVRDNPGNLYGDIDLAVKDLASEVSIPVALRQLAKISNFKLIVTLTPDDLLAQALRDEKRAVNEIVHSPKLPTSTEGNALQVDWEKPGSPVQLLYLFGKVEATALYSIHDEDVLEYAHNVIARGSHAPNAFMSALHDRNLLLIGCNFPDWLSRFMMRATRKGPLGDKKGSQAWLVEPLGKADPFIGFLGKHSRQTEVLSNIDPVQFVDELYERWNQAHGGRASDAAPPPPAPEAQSALFFISYSRTTDLAAATNLQQALRKLGVTAEEIWFDRETLEPGDDYKRRILQGINDCRFFLPLVSRAATERDRAFLFREWEKATDVRKERKGTYLLPLVVDEVNRPEAYDQESVADWRERNINFSHAPAGVLDEALMGFFKDLVRKARDGR